MRFDVESALSELRRSSLGITWYRVFPKILFSTNYDAINWGKPLRKISHAGRQMYYISSACLKVLYFPNQIKI